MEINVIGILKVDVDTYNFTSQYEIVMSIKIYFNSEK